MFNEALEKYLFFPTYPSNFSLTKLPHEASSGNAPKAKLIIRPRERPSTLCKDASSDVLRACTLSRDPCLVRAQRPQVCVRPRMTSAVYPKTTAILWQQLVSRDLTGGSIQIRMPSVRCQSLVVVSQPQNLFARNLAARSVCGAVWMSVQYLVSWPILNLIRVCTPDLVYTEIADDIH